MLGFGSWVQGVANGPVEGWAVTISGAWWKRSSGGSEGLWSPRWPHCVLCLQPPGCPDYAMLSFMGGFHGRTLGKLSPVPPRPSAHSACPCTHSTSGEDRGSLSFASEAPPALKQNVWVTVGIDFIVFWKILFSQALIFILNLQFPVYTQENLTPGVKSPQTHCHSLLLVYISSIPVLSMLPESAVTVSSVSSCLWRDETHLVWATCSDWQRLSCSSATVPVETDA